MNWQLNFVFAVAGTASVLSAWIAIRTAGIRGLPGCGEGSGCDAVMTSRFARLGMLPVAGLAATLYAALATLAIIAVLASGASQLLHRSIVCLAMIGVGAAVWFIVLQLAVVRRGCLYCNTVHLLAIVCLVFSVLGIHPSPTELTVASGLATLAVVALIAGQLMLRPRSYAVVRAADTSSREIESHPHYAIKVEEPTAATPPGKVIVPQQPVCFLDRRVRLNVGEWPMLGAEQAKRFVAYLFDYTCPPCRSVHELVSQVAAGDPDLAILLLPLPQHPSCNPEVKEVAAGRGYACHYARLSLAVWRSCPEQYKQFEQFLSDGPEAPPIGLAVRWAIELCGRGLDPHRADEETDRSIRKAIDVYRSLQIKKVPTLLFAHAQVAGQLRTLAELKSVFDRELYRRRPSGNRLDQQIAQS